MIRLMELFPDHLDLNGDSGNLLVLERRIEWGGLSSSRESVLPGQTPNSRPDVLLIGHGSAAAWKQVYAELARLAPMIQDWLKQGTQVLAISSGFAALHGLIDGLPISVDRSQRVSKFVVDEFEGEQVFGYLNSELQLPAMIRHGNILGSMLHGPLLAKNTGLADQIIESVMASAIRAEINSSKFDEIELLATAARKLAEEQAND
jgi:CobQ-like glutamine amidotransferase family enzyme